MNKTQLTAEDLKKYIRTFWYIIIGGILFAALFLTLIGLGAFGKLPSFVELENPKNSLATEVRSADGKVLGTYYRQNRSYTKYEELSPNIINALIATEDIRYYEHSGIDIKRTFTIIFYNLAGNRQGASTITQQLALNLFSEEGRSRSTLKRGIQKLKEWITAVKLEYNYTKEEIITMYLNTVDFGNNSFGIKAAARTYYNTTPDKLTIDQSAVLIGLLKGTTIFNPIRNPNRSTARRNTVLYQMNKNKFIDDETYEILKNSTTELDYQPTDHNEGLAPYFREYLRIEITKMLRDGTIKNKPDGTPYDLYRDGLRIYTTIHSDMQRYAEEAEKEHLAVLQKQFFDHWKGRVPWEKVPEVIGQGMRRSDRYLALKNAGASEDSIKREFDKPIRMSVFSWKGDIDTVMSPLDSVKYYKMFLRSAMMSMEPQTGYIRAWVGGINYKHFKYDQVKDGARQVGSTFKPFVYTVAIDNGFSPCFQIENRPVVFEDFNNYSPKNSDNKTGGVYTVRQGLARSVNIITAYLIKQVGPKSVADLAKRMGLTGDIPAYPSIALGVTDVTIYDMVGAYSVYANKGIWTEPTYLIRIEDKNGNLLYNKVPRKREVLSEQTAYVMLYMLEGTTTLQGGTGQRLRFRYGFTNPIAGKTGTTQNNSDGWFMGITPQLVTGVWTGNEDRGVHFRSINLGEGANMALPVWALYMQKVYKDPKLNYSKGPFEAPIGGVNIELNCDMYNQSRIKRDDRDDRLGF